MLSIQIFGRFLARSSFQALIARTKVAAACVPTGCGFTKIAMTSGCASRPTFELGRYFFNRRRGEVVAEFQPKRDHDLIGREMHG